MKDFIKCSNCEKTSIIETGGDVCPKCNKAGCLSWVNDDKPEVEDDYKKDVAIRNFFDSFPEDKEFEGIIKKYFGASYGGYFFSDGGAVFSYEPGHIINFIEELRDTVPFYNLDVYNDDQEDVRIDEDDDKEEVKEKILSLCQ
jgi:hypothetical protein